MSLSTINEKFPIIDEEHSTAMGIEDVFPKIVEFVKISRLPNSETINNFNETRTRIIHKISKHFKGDLFFYCVQIFDHILSLKPITNEEMPNLACVSAKLIRDLFLFGIHLEDIYFTLTNKNPLSLISTINSLAKSLCCELDFDFLYFPVVIFLDKMNEKLNSNIDIRHFCRTLFILILGDTFVSKYTYGELSVSLFFVHYICFLEKCQKEMISMYVEILSCLFSIDETLILTCCKNICKKIETSHNFPKEIFMELSTNLNCLVEENTPKNMVLTPPSHLFGEDFQRKEERKKRRINIDLSEEILLGEGTFGEVYKIENSSGQYAIKKFRIGNNEDPTREIAYSLFLNHKNIVKTYGYRLWSDKFNFIFFSLVQECCESDLEQYLKKNELDENLIKLWSKQLLLGLKYLHTSGIVHRDIKPANILIKNGVLKISDFGLCKMWLNDKCSNTGGVITILYRPPEFFESELCGKSCIYDFSSDTWSLGCVIFELKKRKPLFYPVGRCFSEESILLEIRKYISKGDEDVLDIDSLNDDKKFKTFVESILIFDKNNRLTPSKILDSTYLKDE